MRIICLIFLLFSVSACTTVGTMRSAAVQAKPDPQYRTYSPEKKHHTERGFQNVGGFKPSPGAGFVHHIFNRFSKSAVLPDNHVLSHDEVQQQLKRARSAPVSVTWIGHSTMLIRVGEKWILTDPFFGERASPVPGIGPSRSVPAALSVAELPPIDVIMISHNHYDHLDGPAMAQLARRNPDAVVLVPLVNGGTARRAGFRDVRELDWYDEENAGGLRVTSLPAVHSSRRGLMNKNKALWGGWSIRAGKRRIYFGGDTGYGTFARDIREKLGRHHIALVPIGAYQPQSLESAFHVTPEDAVRIARTLGARHIFPMHWGTIALTAEPFKEQKRRFLAASKGLRGAKVMKIGATVALR